MGAFWSLECCGLTQPSIRMREYRIECFEACVRVKKSFRGNARLPRRCLTTSTVKRSRLCGRDQMEGGVEPPHSKDYFFAGVSFAGSLKPSKIFMIGLSAVLTMILR